MDFELNSDDVVGEFESGECGSPAAYVCKTVDAVDAVRESCAACCAHVRYTRYNALYALYTAKEFVL